MWTPDQLRSQVVKFHSTEYSWERPVEPLYSTRKSAVLIPLEIENGTVKVWLTKRSQLVSIYPGDVSFPGGKKDKEDRSAVDTALREAQEEIGLDSSQVDVVAELVPRLSIHVLIVTPIVGIVRPGFHPKLSGEVALAFKLPLERFLSGENHWTTVYESPLDKDYIHFFRDTVTTENVTTWGMTAHFITELACGIMQKQPEFTFSMNGEMMPSDPFCVQRKFLNKIINNEKSKL